MTPIDMIKTFINNGQKPQDFINKAINNNSNPLIGNLVQMAKSGNSQGIENFARNIMKEKGRDFDKEFADFMSQRKR